MSSASISAEQPAPAGITAIISATAAAEDGSPGALLLLDDQPLLARLCHQLRSQGADDITVLTRPEWSAAISEAVPGPRFVSVTSLGDALDAVAETSARSAGPVVIAQGEILTQDAVLTGLVRDPRVATGVVSSGRSIPGEQTLRMFAERGRIVAGESAYHSIERASGSILGLLKVSAGDRPALTDTARELADLCRDQVPAAWEEELAVKVRVWGAAFFQRNAPQVALAEQLERVQGTTKWLPDPATIRGELDQAFYSQVLHRAAVAADDIVSLLVTGLVRSQQVLTIAHLRELFWSRPLSQERLEVVREKMATIDEDRILLRSAVKGSDGFFTTFLVSPYSKYIARWCARRNLTPNQVTTFSMGLGIASAAAFATGTRAGLIAGAVLLQLAFTADCVDGQLARYTRQFSKLGAWLDSVFDRGKEYVVFVGLALGATRTGSGSEIWLLAAAALALQTFRHTIDFSYAATQHVQITNAAHAPLLEPADFGDHIVEEEEAVAVDRGNAWANILSGLGRAGIRASRAFERRPWMKWSKRILVLPIGERFALISLTAAIFVPRVTFIALLTWGSVAAIYTILGRVLRSFA